MADPFDNDFAAGTATPLSGLTMELAKLVEENFSDPQETQHLGSEDLVPVDVPEKHKRIVQFANTLEGVAKRMIPEVVSAYLAHTWEPASTSKIRGLVAEALFSNEQRLREGFCGTVLDVVLLLAKLEEDQLGTLVEMIVQDSPERFRGELINRNEAVCVIEARDEGCMSSFTSSVPLRDIQCVALTGTQETVLNAWKVVGLKLYDEDEKARLSPRDSTIHRHACWFQEIAKADRMDRTSTSFRIQLKGGSVLKGQLVDIGYRGILLTQEDHDENPDIKETYYFVPYEVIRVPGIDSDRYDEIAIRKAKRKGENIPGRITRKMEEQRRKQYTIESDSDFLPKA